ncbi:IS200/IS605 family transposase [Thiolapillus sp.]|uniref:IS200/IS605 family transposase n=8 Tax=Thiolapillus sp. TaxID=2017437 RepID=UPI0027E5840E|nr:IS200/IS605 family transposase [Thiolapillus sp.]
MWNMVQVVHNRNSVYQTAYHLVWCPKYRKALLTGQVAKTLDGLLDVICQERGWPVISKEIQPDHIHLFLGIPPAIAVADAVKIIKGTKARKLFARFPALRKQFRGGSLWSPSYYVGTAGNVSAETIQRYIERTEHIKGRR